ncbi:hypothetical protein C9374_006796 [Naegleria lovaniensis]|uniref:Uncharacterized protein n=1 Tax=Naegleria lovaniensis TaxID=51637 RepID=A0AA88KXI2_NAELO|nr:uncharacterized protein C9374_006796 [Naegleria lovaniensis]KAG2393265.1 hypothetical protein C9374_006796 [Naegleria lovaniensis]
MISTPQHPSQSAATTTTPQSLNLMNPTTPQQRITIEKLLLIPPESVQSRNPKLYDLLIQLRRQYLWQAVTTPVVTTTTTATNNKDCGMHPLEKMKQEDAMVFASHIDEICNCVNNLLDELNEEEYELGSTVGYRARWLQEEELKVRAKVNAIAAPNDESEMLDPMHEDEEFEEDVEDVEEEEGIEGGDEDHHVISNPTSVTSSECVETHGTNTEHLGLSTSSAPVVASAEQSSTPEQQQDEYDEEDSEMIDNEETESSSLSNNINAQSQDGSSSKLQDFFRQLETVEPIPNGKLSFFQNHHLVVGKFDRQALVQNNILSCTVMKKSTLNVVVHRRCTRLRNDTDVNSRFTPFDATSGNYHDRRILKKQALAKSVVRFAKVKVDFGSIVEQVLQSQNQHSLPFSANLLSALGTFSTSNSTQSQQ